MNGIYGAGLWAAEQLRENFEHAAAFAVMALLACWVVWLLWKIGREILQ